MKCQLWGTFPTCRSMARWKRAPQGQSPGSGNATVVALQPFLNLGQFLRPVAAGPPSAEGVVEEIERLHEVPQQGHALLQASPFLFLFRSRHAGATNGQRLRVQGQLVLPVMADKGETGLA